MFLCTPQNYRPSGIPSGHSEVVQTLTGKEKNSNYSKQREPHLALSSWCMEPVLLHRWELQSGLLCTERLPGCDVPRVSGARNGAV